MLWGGLRYPKTAQSVTASLDVKKNECAWDLQNSNRATIRKMDSPLITIQSRVPLNRFRKTKLYCQNYTSYLGTTSTLVQSHTVSSKIWLNRDKFCISLLSASKMMPWNFPYFCDFPTRMMRCGGKDSDKEHMTIPRTSYGRDDDPLNPLIRSQSKIKNLRPFTSGRIIRWRQLYHQ